MEMRSSPGPSRLIYLTGGIALVAMSAYFLVPAVHAGLKGTLAGATEVTVFLALVGLGLLACGAVALGVASGWGAVGTRSVARRGGAAFTILGGAGGVYWLLELRDSLSAPPPLAATVLVAFFALAGGMWGVILSGIYVSLRRGRGARVLPRSDRHRGRLTRPVGADVVPPAPE